MKTVDSKRRGKEEKSTGKERAIKLAALLCLKDLDALNPFPEPKRPTISNLAWRCYLYNKWLIIGTVKLKVCLQNIRYLAHKHNTSGNTTSRFFKRDNETVPLEVGFLKEKTAKFMNIAHGNTAPSRSVNPFLETCHKGNRVNIVQEIAVDNLDPLLPSVNQPYNSQDSEDMALVQSLCASKKFCPIFPSQVVLSPVASTQQEKNCSPYKFLGIHISPWSTHTPHLFSPPLL
ncbi:uncharacterized protein LOC135210332 isoform X1 [Macrobrachium nipponense]|uniref:uncharacterized protein LOC135210332 isoform X1 n=1 Tax=Macrobrachium nipponense TaxID=159736 RepID=UPI0030C87628